MIFNGIDSSMGFSAVILAGGNSERMGYPKPWLKSKYNTTFLAGIVAALQRYGIKDIIVVLNEKFATVEWEKELFEIEANAKIIKNYHVEKGRLFSVQLGLKAALSDYVFIHNVDNPFIEYSVLKLLTENLETNGTTIPSFNGKGGHPVVVNAAVKNEIMNNFHCYETLKNILKNFPKKYVNVNSSKILANINTPHDLDLKLNELV